jgi:hypothetical protein
MKKCFERNYHYPFIIDSTQGVSEIRVLILICGRTRQFMEIFSL